MGATLEAVSLPEGLTVIGSEAFEECEYLQEIMLPSSLLSIEDNAFTYTESLRHIDLPDGLESIESGVFYGSALRRVTVPDTVTDLGVGAFRSCEHLESAEVGVGVTEMDIAFNDCPGLKWVILPDSLEYRST